MQWLAQIDAVIGVYCNEMACMHNESGNTASTLEINAIPFGPTFLCMEQIKYFQHIELPRLYIHPLELLHSVHCVAELTGNVRQRDRRDMKKKRKNERQRRLGKEGGQQHSLCLP